MDSILNRVVFPAPLAPKITSVWPQGTVRWRSHKTGHSPKLFSKECAWTASVAAVVTINALRLGYVAGLFVQWE